MRDWEGREAVLRDAIVRVHGKMRSGLEDLGEKNPLGETNRSSAVCIHASSERRNSHIPAIEIFAALEDGSRLQIPRHGRPQHAAGFMGQFCAIPDSELGKERRDMKLHGSHGDVQFGGNFLVGAVADHGIQNFALPGTEGSRMGRGAAFGEKFLGACQHLARDVIFGGNENHEIVGIVAPCEALHGQ